MPAFFTFEIPLFSKHTGYLRAEVMAMETDTPGILLTEADGGDKMYRLTHRKSGLLITSGRWGLTGDVFGLLQVARDLAAATDWTQDAKSICTKEVGAFVRAVLASSSIDWITAHESAALRHASDMTIAGA